MKTAEEILKDNLSDYLWEVLEGYKDEDNQYYFKGWILEAMEEYAQQFKPTRERIIEVLNK